MDQLKSKILWEDSSRLLIKKNYINWKYTAYVIDLEQE